MAQSGCPEWIEPFTLKRIQQDKTVKITVLGDGSCFFHAILRSFHFPYIKTKSVNDRKAWAKQVRHDLAATLTEVTPDGKLYYDTLANGELRAMSKQSPEVSLAVMQAELRSSHAVSNIYHQMVSDKLNKDIYLINYLTGDVYPTGTKLTDLYKGRSSIVIAVLPGHYDTIGIVRPDGIIDAHFAPDHPFIVKVRKRLQAVVKSDAPSQTPSPVDTLTAKPVSQPVAPPERRSDDPQTLPVPIDVGFTVGAPPPEGQFAIVE